MPARTALIFLFALSISCCDRASDHSSPGVGAKSPDPTPVVSLAGITETDLQQPTNGEPAPPSSTLPYKFLGSYKIAYYLDLAIKFQSLPVGMRADRLRLLAVHRNRGSEIYPLCRLLFEGGSDKDFRRPMLGGAHFVGNMTYDDFSLEPIAIVAGVPILIVKGYSLIGFPEHPDQYLDYCLRDCVWRTTPLTAKDSTQVQAAIDALISEHPTLKIDEGWLREQARQ